MILIIVKKRIIITRKGGLSMVMKEVTAQEFTAFAEHHPLYSFYQTEEWAHLKQSTGWGHHYLLMRDENEVVAGCMMLVKDTPLHKKICYAPRGFLIDYRNETLVAEFTRQIKAFLKKEQGIFLKIDPPVIYREKDINGDLVTDGIDNRKVVTTLKQLGYHHYGFDKSITKELQPRWVFVLDLQGKDKKMLFQNFNSNTKRSIKRAESFGLEVRQMRPDELGEFKKIMQHTADRRGFLDRSFSYYQRMMEETKEHCKIFLCFLDTEKAITNLEQTKQELSTKKNRYEEQLKTNPSHKKTANQLQEVIRQLESLEKKLTTTTALQQQYGKKITLGGSMFLHYGTEMLYLFGGSYADFMYMNPQYLIQWYSLQYALDHGCDVYNFYGIDGHIKEDGEMHGVYEFKKGFDGNVVEYIGEFDLVIHPIYYQLYKFSFALYGKLKRIKHHS